MSLPGSQYYSGVHAKYYSNCYSLYGEWKNGQRVGIHTLRYYDCEIKVKFKEGLYYKVVGVNYSKTGLFQVKLIFTVPIIKGEFYEEQIRNDKQYSFYLYNSRPLFDGKVVNMSNVKKLTLAKWEYFGELLDDELKPGICEINSDYMKIIGFNINFVFIRDVKIILHKKIVIKTKMKGFYLYDECILKCNDYKLSFYNKFNQPEDIGIIKKKGHPIEVFYRFSTNTIDYPGNRYFMDIIDYLLRNYRNFLKFMKNIIDFNQKTCVVNSLFNKTSWIEYENSIQKNPKNNEFENKSLEDSKNLISLNHSESYEGSISNNTYQGIGKYRYKNGDVYLGEFKNGLRHGLGILNFSDGSRYRGYWKDDKPYNQGVLTKNGQKLKINYKLPVPQIITLISYPKH